MSNLELPSTPWIVGHRGAAGEFCENTLPSFKRALEADADMIELDVQLTLDGELVCFHDWTLERLGGREDSVEASLSELVTRITIAPDGSRIPLLKEALEVIPESLPLNVELKRRKAPPVKLLRTVLDQLDGRGQILISSFDWELLEKLRKLAPDLALAPIERHQPGKLLDAGKKFGAFSLHCHRRLVTRHFIERAAAEGFDRVLVYTVNEPSQADRMVEAGVSGIFTDLPSQLVEHFKSRP